MVKSNLKEVPEDWDNMEEEEKLYYINHTYED
jgi:hypothetical protein